MGLSVTEVICPHTVAFGKNCNHDPKDCTLIKQLADLMKDKRDFTKELKEFIRKQRNTVNNESKDESKSKDDKKPAGQAKKKQNNNKPKEYDESLIVESTPEPQTTIEEVNCVTEEAFDTSPRTCSCQTGYYNDQGGQVPDYNQQQQNAQSEESYLWTDTTRHFNEWVLDSAGSYHYCIGKDLFQDIECLLLVKSEQPMDTKQQF
mgnify:CR=1 FL=1